MMRVMVLLLVLLPLSPAVVGAEGVRAAVDWRSACGAMDGLGVHPSVSRSDDGGFVRCRSRSVPFGTAQPVRAAMRYGVLSRDGAVSEARLVLEVRSRQDVQQAYARLRDGAGQVVRVVLGQPLPEEVGVAIMDGVFGREWALGDGRVALRRTGGGSRAYDMEVRVYP